MAGEWLKMRLDLAEDPAVIAMAAMLDCDEDLIVGKLHRLWSWADRQSRDGHATGVTGKWIDRFIRLAGFAEAMAQVNWLYIDEAGISLPNFDRHNGETAKTRALGAKRQQKARSGSNAPVTPASRSDRDGSVTREEKRREEAKEQSSGQAPTTTEGATAAGLACRAMREAGCAQGLNPSHPDLLAALQEGVTAQTLADTVREAIANNIRKPFAWAITTARGRLADGATALTTGPPNGARLGKTAQGIQILEGMKNGMAEAGNFDGVPKAALPRIGPPAGG